MSGGNVDQSRKTQAHSGLRQSIIPLLLVALVAAASFHAAYVALTSDSALRARYLTCFRRGVLLSLCPEHLAVIAVSATVTMGLLVLALFMSGLAFRASYDLEAIVSWFGNLGMDGPLDTGALLRVALLYPLVQHAFFGLSRAMHPGELSGVLLACGNVGFVGLLVSQFGPDFPCEDTESDTRSE
jgi:hypothetical protein